MCIGKAKRAIKSFFGLDDDKKDTTPPPLPEAPEPAPGRNDSGVKKRRNAELARIRTFAGTQSLNATGAQGLTSVANTNRRKLLG